MKNKKEKKEEKITLEEARELLKQVLHDVDVDDEQIAKYMEAAEAVNNLSASITESEEKLRNIGINIYVLPIDAPVTTAYVIVATSLAPEHLQKIMNSKLHELQERYKTKDITIQMFDEAIDELAQMFAFLLIYKSYTYKEAIRAYKESLKNKEETLEG